MQVLGPAKCRFNTKKSPRRLSRFLDNFNLTGDLLLTMLSSCAWLKNTFMALKEPNKESPLKVSCPTEQCKMTTGGPLLVATARDFGLRGLGYGSQLPQCGTILCPWARHFTCMCTLSTQEYMGTWLDSDCLCVWIVTSAAMAAGAVCSLGSWVGTGTNRSYN